MTVYTGMGTNTELMSRIFVGTVEENVDPLRRARIKVRIQSLHDELPVDQIPWCSPLQNESGKHFIIPAIGKIVSVIFGNNSLYESYYMHCDNFNINLINKLESLSDDEYKNFIALAFDHRTQIYADDSNLTLDYLYNKVTIDNKSINAELKDNNQSLNLGSADANQQAILGNHFIDWLDKLVDAWIKPESMIGNMGVPIVQSEITAILTEYKIIRKTFLSNNVNIVDNYKVKKLRRNPSSVSAQHDVYQADDHTAQQKELLLKITDEVTKEDEKMKSSIPTNVINVLDDEVNILTDQNGTGSLPVDNIKKSDVPLDNLRIMYSGETLKQDEQVVTQNMVKTEGGGKNYLSEKETEDVKKLEAKSYGISDDPYNPEDMLLESKWKQEFVTITDDDYNILNVEGMTEGEFIQYTPKDIPYYDSSMNGDKTVSSSSVGSVLTSAELSKYISQSKGILVPIGDPSKDKIIITSLYFRVSSGAFHGGLDFGYPIGTPIRAADDGVVASLHTSESGAGGLYIFLKHKNDFFSFYCHLSGILVKNGQSVKKGDIIGKCGNTGTHSSGPHLHFEWCKGGMSKNRTRIDPMTLFDSSIKFVVPQIGGYNKVYASNELIRQKGVA